MTYYLSKVSEFLMLDWYNDLDFSVKRADAFITALLVIFTFITVIILLLFLSAIKKQAKIIEKLAPFNRSIGFYYNNIIYLWIQSFLLDNYYKYKLINPQ